MIFKVLSNENNSIILWSYYSPFEVKKHLHFLVLLGDIMSAEKDCKIEQGMGASFLWGEAGRAGNIYHCKKKAQGGLVHT